MRRSVEAAMFGFVGIVMLACGGKQSVASKSAEAYREAVAQGKEVAGGGHGGHHAEQSDTAPGVGTGAGHDMTAMQHETGTAMAGMDHAQMEHSGAGAMNHGSTDHAEMAGMGHGTSGSTQMNHANMQHGASSSTHNMPGMKQGSMQGMDHSAMQHDSAAASHDMAGMQHGSAQATDHAAMNHSQMQHGSTGSSMPNMNMDHSQMQNMPGMSHGSMPGMQHGGAIPAGGLWGPQSGSLQQTDAIDTPAPSSVREAQKSASDDMSGMDHGASATTDVKQDVTYTCPMHPEVISSQPGTCPKCGMLLVRRGSK